MREATEEEIPLTITWKRLLDDEAVFEVMIVDVPTDPPMLEVRVLPLEESVCEVARLVIVALEMFAFVMVDDEEVRSVIVPLVIVVVARSTVPVAVRLPVANEVEDA